MLRYFHNLRASFARNAALNRSCRYSLATAAAGAPPTVTAPREYRQLVSLIRQRQIPAALEYLQNHNSSLRTEDYGKLMHQIRSVNHEKTAELGRLAYDHWEIMASASTASVNLLNPEPPVDDHLEHTRSFMKHMLAQSMINSGQSKEAEAMLMDLIQQHPEHSSHYRSTLLQLYGKMKDSKQSAKKIESLIKNITDEAVDTHLFCALIYTFAGKKNFDRLDNLVQRMENLKDQDKFEFNEPIYAALIRAYSHHDFARAQEYLETMQSEGLSWNDSMFRPLLDAAVHKQDFKSAFSLLDSMQSKFIPPCADSIAVLLRSLDFGYTAEEERLDQLVRSHFCISEDWEQVMMLPEKTPITDKLAVELIKYLARVERPDLIDGLHQLVMNQNVSMKPRNCYLYLESAFKLAPKESMGTFVDFAFHQTGQKSLDPTTSTKIFELMLRQTSSNNSSMFEHILKKWNSFVTAQSEVSLKSLNGKLLHVKAWPISIYQLAMRHYNELEQSDRVQRLLAHLVKGIKDVQPILSMSEKQIMAKQLDALATFDSNIMTKAQSFLKEK